MLAISILAYTGLEGSGKRVRIESKDMVGTWIGLTTDELQMIRLVLPPDGQGVIGFSELAEAPCVFRISLWTLRNGQVDLNLGRSLGGCPQDRKFSGVIKGASLEITVQGDGWKRSASLRKEENLFERWKRLRVTMEPN
jgi:hypothetical protein